MKRIRQTLPSLPNLPVRGAPECAKAAPEVPKIVRWRPLRGLFVPLRACRVTSEAGAVQLRVARPAGTLGRRGEVREVVEAVLDRESAAFVPGATRYADGGAPA